MIAHAEHRILLTRDLHLLKRSIVTHGYYVRETEAVRQAAEVVRRYRCGVSSKSAQRSARSSSMASKGSARTTSAS